MAGTETPFDIVSKLKDYADDIGVDDYLASKITELYSALAPPEELGIDTPNPTLLIAVKDRRDWHRGQEEKYKELYDSMREELGEEWFEEGRESEKINGRTIYRTHNIRAYIKVAKIEEAVPILKAREDTNGLPKMGVNSNSLTAWVKELERDQNDKPIIPEELKGYIDISDKWELVVR